MIKHGKRLKQHKLEPFIVVFVIGLFVLKNISVSFATNLLFQTFFMSLQTSNPQHITWQYESISVAVLGGIRLDGLDRLRVTLKLDYSNDTIRQNLDLYQDTQTDKFIRKAAERFGIGAAYIGKMLLALTNELEAWRITELERQHGNLHPVAKALSETERREAETFLKEPDLLGRINAAIGASGLVGEEDNRLLMYLIFSSRKREYPLHIISLASSGTGKSHLQEGVAALIPDEDKLEITVMTENAFYYFGQRELKNKLLLIEDLDGAQNALYPIRELQSKKRITKTIAQRDKAGNTQTVSITVEGPVSVAGCTTKEQIYEDNANRSFLVYLDDSKEQDQRIMQRQKLVSAGLVDGVAEQATRNLLQNVQRLLQPITVRNPFAPLLELPDEVFKPRRTNKHYLDFIEAVTFLKQYQRIQHTDPSSGEIYIETTLDDIREANALIAPVLLRKSDDLNGATRNYLEHLKAYLAGEPGLETFTNKSMSKALRVPLSTVKRYHLQLLHIGYISILHQDNQGDKAYHYQLVSTEEYTALKNRIYGALNGLLHQMEQTACQPDRVQPIGPASAHTGSEPMEAKPVKGSGHRPTQPVKKGIPPKKSI